TTLLEGSVRVSSFQVVSSDRPASQSGQAASVILKPGQQAQIVNAAGGRPEDTTTASAKTRPGIKVITDADIDKVMAWKNGAFNFNNASLKDAMKQLERWYDIEVVYEKGVPDIHF